jgi:exoribonuclease-2
VRRGGELRVEVVARDRARDLIEVFMIAANVAVAEWLAARGRAALVRVVRAPDRWRRIAALAASCGTRLPDAPDGPALAAFLARRREADPEQYAELSLAVVKLLGAGEYAVGTPATTAAGTSRSAAAVTCTRPRPTAATPTSSRSGW